MPRFKDRALQLRDLHNRFEAQPSSNHLRNARGFIERLKYDGRLFWEIGSTELQRWEEYCTTLWVFLNRLGSRKELHKQGLGTALREFIQEFEHCEYRLYQMMYGTSDDPDTDPKINQVLDWLDQAFRASIYGVLSYWLDDKQQHELIEITVNMATGDRTEKRTVDPMTVPKQYRHSTKRLR